MSNELLDLDLLDRLLEEEEGLPARPARRIPARPSGEHCPLSQQQKRLWFLHQLDPASASFNVSGAVVLRGSLDQDALAWSLDQIVARHESLRTELFAIDGEPWQRIADLHRLPLAHHDLSRLDDDARDAAIQDAIARETSRSFDLGEAPLIRAALLRCGAREHVLIITAHHIVCDGWSIGIFMSELAHFYRVRVDGSGASLAALPVHYGDYACWQREHDQTAQQAAELAYWNEQLADLPVLHLPWDRPRSDRAVAMLGGSVARDVPPAVAGALRRVAGDNNATLASVLMAGFQCLLYRYSGQSDFGIGLASSNRGLPELEGVIGFFVNMLVVRADLSGTSGFGDIVARARDTMIEALDHADVPFEMVVDRIRPERHLNRHPLFQVSFVFQNLPDRELRMPGLSLARIGEDQTARFDLEIFITEHDDVLRVNWVYDARLFDPDTVAGMADAYVTLLEQAAAEPDAPIDRLRLIAPSRGLELMTAADRARRSFPAEPCLHQVFAATAARFPRRTALVDGARKWRYRDVEAAANRIARQLIANGVEPGSFVGLYHRRSADMVLSILAILQVGGTYVPIDPIYPPERVQFILADSGVTWVLADRDLLDRLPPGEHAFRILVIDPEHPPTEAHGSNLGDEPQTAPSPPAVAVTPDTVAYIIYTSGSTGTPKGCLVTHGNAVRLMRATEAWFGFDETDVWTLFHSCAFDFSVWEMWGAWFYGGRLVVVPHEISRDTASFYDLLCAQRVTVLNQTPSAFKSLIEVDRVEQRDGELALRYVIFGGEALDLGSLRPWMERHGDAHPQLVNMYGITETTVHVTYRLLDHGDVLFPRGSVIGRPIPDLAIHILDAARNPVPPGAIGEMYVGGAGVSLGYLNRDELTSQRFIRSPVTTSERWYRTGDLGRQLGDGDIEFRGRADQQVKIRGFRIELDEIRSRIQTVSAVRDSLVIADTNGADSRLIAYVVPDRVGLSSREDPRRVAGRQVTEWQDTFDSTYAGNNPTGVEEFNTAGWLQSYTGGQIPDHEMREWLDDTLAAIRALAPRRVLEIGCGTGMLLLDLAPATAAYVGLDLSSTTIERLAEIVAHRGLDHVELHHKPADDLDHLHGRRFDVIVLNSVVQYFPDEDYLVGVLRACIGLLDQGGAIFVGDVRNLALLDGFHASVAWSRSAPDTPRHAVAESVRLDIQKEEELLLDPAYFTGLPDRVPEIRTVVTSARPGSHANELNKYRYDVYLLRSELAEPARARLRRAPSSEVLDELANDLAVAEWIAGERPGSCAADLDLTVTAPAPALALPSRRAVHPLRSDPDRPFNQPALARAARLLVADIRSSLARFLPEYMIPAHLVMLDEFPVTAHGKIDVAALPRPDAARSVTSERFVAPQPGIESELAAVWCEVLNLERVGRDDSFFELGGHSLLATQLIARINERLATKVALRAVFEHPTLAGFAGLLDEPANETDGETDGDGASPADIIPRAERTGAMPLSFGQQRLWFLAQLDPGRATYNTFQAIDVRGPLDLDVLSRALDAVVARHEILRTSVAVVDGQPRQIIHDHASCPLIRHAATYRPDGSADESLQRALLAEATRPFDLDQAPLVRAAVYSEGSSRHTLLLVVHHIAIDGWSLGVLFRELDACYRAYRRGESPALPPLAIQYADHATWQRTWIHSDEAAAQAEYWHRCLSSPPAESSLPHDIPQGISDQPDTGATIVRHLSPRLTEALAAYRIEHRTTLFMILASALYILLYRVSGKDDLVIGSPIAQRNRRELEPLIGFFVNTLALRARPRSQQTFRAFVAQVRQTVLDAYARQNYPFELLVEKLVSERDGTRNPLFQVMLAVQNHLVAAPDWDGLDCRIVDLAPAGAKFDLTIFAAEDAAGAIVLTAEYRSGCYREETIRACLEALHRILDRGLAEPDIRLADIPLVDTATAHDSPAPRDRRPPGLLLDMIARSAARHPEAIAVEHEDRCLSYRELAHDSDRIASALIAAGALPEQPIGVALDPSPEAIALFLGILKAGCTYLPLDPRHPVERLRAIVEDARPGLVVAGRDGFLDDIAVYSPADLRERAVHPASLSRPILPDQLAYVIYTSGSTGRPKGVMVTHRGVANLAATEIRHYGTEHGDRVLLAANLTFDASISEIINVLVSGATLVILARDRLIPGDELVAELRDKAITWWTIRPSFLSLLRDRDLPDLRTLIIAGEKLEREVVAPWLAPGRAVFNAYGPTEATVCASCDRLDDEAAGTADEPTIGRPLDNVRLHVLDRWLNVVPDGMTGELCIGGVGVSRGYLGRPALTAERFVPDPFAPVPGSRMYRTGDVARRLPDGRLVCLGRTDFQIKLRGYRIDPGEIESCLLRIPEFRDAVVTCRRDRDRGDSLLAHVVTDLPAAAAEHEALAHLRERLPDYMIPGRVVALSELPLSANGKLDRAALPDPVRAQSAPVRGADAPRTSLEWQLCLLFERVLERSPIGAEQSFFELGGHSFSALRLVSEIGRELGEQVPVGRVFTHPTVRTLATVLGRQDVFSAQSGLVAIRTTGERAPLYLVHQAGGYVYAYFALARHLPEDRPVYGLQPPGLDDATPPLADLADQARHHVDAIRAFQPRGPYHLAGHSLGGVIAYEMARQLRADGEDVAYLGMIDCHLPEDDQPEPEPRAAFAFMLEQIEGQFSRSLGVTLEGDDPATWIGDTARALARTGIADEAVAGRHVAGIYRVFAAGITAYRSYRPGPYEGAGYRYETRSLAETLAARPALSWESWLLGGAASYVIPGEHLDLLQEPHVATLGALMSQHLSNPLISKGTHV